MTTTRRRLGWAVLGLGVRVLHLGNWIMDQGEKLAPIPLPPGLTERIMVRILAERGRESAALLRPEVWKDEV
jgi:hypothetical protein